MSLEWLRGVTLRTFCAGLVAVCVVGCGSKPAPKTADNADAPPAQQEPNDMAPPAGQAPAAAVAATTHPAGSAAEAVQQTLNAVKAGRLDQAFDFLPASYQKDVDSVVQDFASRMDAELWDQAFKTLQKGVKVLQEKKALILQAAQQPGMDAEFAELDKNWKGLTDALNTLFGGDLANIEKLKTAQTKQLLQNTGNPLFSQLQALSSVAGPNPLEQLAEVKVTQVGEHDGVVTLSIQSPDRDDAEETEFRQIEGKWIPVKLADSWQESIESAKAQLEVLSPEAIAAQKPQLTQLLKTLDGSFDQMLDAETSEELTAAFFPLMLQGMQLGSMFQSSGGSVSGPTGGVTLLIEGELEDDALTAMLEKLEALADDPDMATYTASTSGGQTIVELKPVKDPVAFAEKLTFAKSKIVAPAKRTVTIELEE